jgi:high frequency lysogenization protein
MSANMKNRAIALAAMFQHLHGVNEIARSGRCQERNLETAVRSVLKKQADSTLEVFGKVDDIRDGLLILSQILAGPSSPNDRALMRYAVGIMQLAKKFTRHPELTPRLDQGIATAERSIEHFGLSHDSVFAGLAGTWTDTIATLSPRIMVAGEQRFLEDPQAVARIRTLLLAAVRAAFLWQQKGGNRWNLILRRRALAEAGLALLGNSPDDEAV